jgi:hypothetical protein
MNPLYSEHSERGWRDADSVECSSETDLVSAIVGGSPMTVNMVIQLSYRNRLRLFNA